MDTDYFILVKFSIEMITKEKKITSRAKKILDLVQQIRYTKPTIMDGKMTVPIALLE